MNILLSTFNSLMPYKVKSTPNYVGRHAFCYLGVDLHNFGDDAAEGINYISRCNYHVSKINRFSRNIGTYPNDLILHLQIFDLEQFVQTLDNLMVFVQDAHHCRLISIAKVDYDPSGLKLDIAT